MKKSLAVIIPTIFLLTLVTVSACMEGYPEGGMAPRDIPTESVEAETAAEVPEGRRYYALLIGQSYTENGELMELAAVRKDIRCFQAMLGTMEGTPYRIQTLTDPGREEIRKGIAETFGEAQEEDVCLLYYGGHGKNSPAKNCRGVMIGAEGETISAEELTEMLRSAAGEKILVMDSCCAGMMTEAAKEEGLWILAAAGAEEEAYDAGTDEETYGCFTWSLLYGSGYDERREQALGTMPADGNGDGGISLGEAYRYAYALTSGIHGEQHPQAFPENGEIILWKRFSPTGID